MIQETDLSRMMKNLVDLKTKDNSTAGSRQPALHVRRGG